ncbi:MAG: glycosyltransferase family 9 protein [Candidatus Eisenbacteria bacterium]
MTNLLIVRLSSFGDIVLTEPVTRAVKQQYQDARLWFVTSAQYSEIPLLFSSVDSVIPYSKGGTNPQLDAVARETQFDAVIDLQGSLRSRRITGELRSGKTVRHRRPRFRRFLSVYMPWLWKGYLDHTVQSYADAARRAGIESHDLVPRVTPPEVDLKKARERFGAGPFIGVCPGGSSPHKRWSEDRFAELVRCLVGDGRQVLIIGSDADRAVAESVVGGLSGEEAGLYISNNIAMIAALLSLCAATVTNDSGLMHLAGAVGSRVVSIFGPTSPLLGFAPMAEGAVVVTRGLSCSPCCFHGNRPCKYETRECLEETDPGEVAGIVADTLREG